MPERVFPLHKVLCAMEEELVETLQRLGALEAVCLQIAGDRSVAGFQDFDRITQVLGQLAGCCGRLKEEPWIAGISVQGSVVDGITLGEIRQRFEKADQSSAYQAGEIELF